MISRYLVINDDLLCNVFTLQRVWIHYKENRYPLTGITVFTAQNCGIHQSGITVLCFRNDGSESSGILILIFEKQTYYSGKNSFMVLLIYSQAIFRAFFSTILSIKKKTKNIQTLTHSAFKKSHK